MRDALQDDGMVHPTGVRRTKGKAVPADEPGLFDQAVSVPRREVTGMFHGSDPITSQAAAVRALPHVEVLRRKILDVLTRMGPLTALELEQMPEFADEAVYEVRRRCSDLHMAKRVIHVGVRGGAALLDLPANG